MPNSCKCILDKLLKTKRIKQFEHDKLLRNIKGIQWHEYPQELPPEITRQYLVTVRRKNSTSYKYTDCCLYRKSNFTEKWNFVEWDDVIAWAEMPEPYEEANDERNN